MTKNLRAVADIKSSAFATIATRGFPRQIRVSIAKSAPEVAVSPTGTIAEVEYGSNIIVESVSVSLGSGPKSIRRAA
jgi:hypothetical protein